MVSLDKAVIASIDKNKKRFEILVDAELAYKIREGADFDSLYGNLLASEEVYFDSKKGERASIAALQNAFGTSDLKAIAKEIILNGRVELTTELRRKYISRKRNEIINYIAENAINPITKQAHPPKRIELAMEKARVNIDPFKNITQQVKDIVEALKPILPITFEISELSFIVPVKYASQVLSFCKGKEIIEKDWQPTALRIKIKISTASKQSFINRLYSLTKGNIIFE